MEVDSASLLAKRAFGLGRNDEEPNIALAEELCLTKDSTAIRELVEGLKNKKPQLANDCIKVLYEIGERNPGLIAGYVKDFIQLLKSPNNRLVWGGMTALAAIVRLRPKEIFEALDVVFKAFESGSVITRDNVISVFAGLIQADRCYEPMVYPILLSHLMSCRAKEVGQHAERAAICINNENSIEFLAVLESRKKALSPAQAKRVEKIMRKIRQETAE